MFLLLSGAGGAKDQQGEEEVAEADGVSVYDQVPQQPARPSARPPLPGGAPRPRQVHQVQANHAGARLQVEGEMDSMRCSVPGALLIVTVVVLVVALVVAAVVVLVLLLLLLLNSSITEYFLFSSSSSGGGDIRGGGSCSSVGAGKQ